MCSDRKALSFGHAERECVVTGRRRRVVTRRVALVAEAVDCCVVWIRFEFVGCTGGSHLPSGIRSGSGNQTEPHSNIIQRIKTPTTQATQTFYTLSYVSIRPTEIEGWEKIVAKTTSEVAGNFSS